MQGRVPLKTAIAASLVAVAAVAAIAWYAAVFVRNRKAPPGQRCLISRLSGSGCGDHGSASLSLRCCRCDDQRAALHRTLAPVVFASASFQCSPSRSKFRGATDVGPRACYDAMQEAPCCDRRMPPQWLQPLQCEGDTVHCMHHDRHVRLLRTGQCISCELTSGLCEAGCNTTRSASTVTSTISPRAREVCAPPHLDLTTPTTRPAQCFLISHTEEDARADASLPLALALRSGGNIAAAQQVSSKAVNLLTIRELEVTPICRAYAATFPDSLLRASVRRMEFAA